MRTTLTVEDDLAEQLSELAHRTKTSFKAVVNDTLRRGLAQTLPPEPPFRVIPHKSGLRPGIDEHRYNELMWELDDPPAPRKNSRK
jgi:hypothetical protein